MIAWPLGERTVAEGEKETEEKPGQNDSIHAELRHDIIHILTKGFFFLEVVAPTPSYHSREKEPKRGIGDYLIKTILHLCRVLKGDPLDGRS